MTGWLTNVFQDEPTVRKSGSKVPSWHPLLAQVGANTCWCSQAKLPSGKAGTASPSVGTSGGRPSYGFGGASGVQAGQTEAVKTAISITLHRGAVCCGCSRLAIRCG